MKLSNLILSLALAVCSIGAACAQDDADVKIFKLTGKERAAAAQIVAGSYNEWTTVSLDGKIGIQRLGIKPSVKIYMERGKRIVMSLRVPLLGEVGTAEITPDKFVIVNKMKKVYCEEPLSQLTAQLPVTINDVQDIFLRRAFLPGIGTLPADGTGADFYLDTEPGWVIAPSSPIGGGYQCGFGAAVDGKLEELMVSDADGTNKGIATYTSNGDKTDIDITITTKGRQTALSLSLDAPNWTPRALSSPEIKANYKKQSLSEFFKSL